MDLNIVFLKQNKAYRNSLLSGFKLTSNVEAVHQSV